MRKLYLYRWLRHHHWRFLRQFLKLRASPHSIALGAAIGVFIGLTPTVGLQMIMGVIIASFVGANRIAAALPAWITNPVTIVPIYSFNYWIGTLFVGGPKVAEFQKVLHEIKLASENGGFGQAARELFNLGMEMFLPLWIGCVLVGLVCAIPTYPLIRRAVILFREKLVHKRAARHSRVRKILIKKSEQEANGYTVSEEIIEGEEPDDSEETNKVEFIEKVNH
ncbi:MAG: DUF2062 domain-containing protein [Planctomycetes bacterium]|nr:DUF2062 domain-containing protein [Planctomycetota bacterium]